VIVLFYQLIEILDSDYSIKVEKQKVGKLFRGAAPRCVINIYYQNFQAGIDLLELSEEWVADIDQSLLDLHSQAQWTEASNIHRKGSILYVSAIVFFLMALEGFINLLYKFLLKPQFRGKEYERAIWKTDLEMRILHLPIYCNGFSSDDINPDDVSYKQWLKLRPFRNNLLHANITEENEFIITVEDHFLFQYNPLFQLTKQKSKKTHTQQLYIRKKDVVQVKQSVEKFASAIIGKMDETEKRWVMSWIDCLEIWFEGNEEKAFIRPVRIPGISSS
ncbi:hypothetical protein KA005_63480, partial [bacterium]|nr:hypothetical protein [bacterium]